jgi:hypothetical protein
MENAHTAHSNFVNHDLPAGAMDGNCWCRVFIPMYITIVATYRDPWTIKDEDAIVTLQQVWNGIYLKRAVFANIPYTIQLHDTIFSIVSCTVSHHTC